MQNNKYKIEVITDSSGQWAGNAMRYATYEEAEAAARDLASRWVLVLEWRVVECDRWAEQYERELRAADQEEC